MLKIKCTFLILILVMGPTGVHAALICKVQKPGLLLW
jgi:hypothetical protein